MSIPRRKPGYQWRTESDGTQSAEFSLWAPDARSVTWMRGIDKSHHPMRQVEAGYWTFSVAGFATNETYGYIVDGHGPFPDPASRFQPEGVHGLSQAIDIRQYGWRNPIPKLPAPARRSIYEMHIGTFTAEGTYDAAREKLPELRNLGVTLIELMPLADFPGNRNWGYDGVALFAPARCYGTPEALCRFIDAAHGFGLGVLLDVVYNHFGPDGNYSGVYSQRYLNTEKSTPWGAPLNFDGPQSEAVRDFYVANVQQWIGEYRFDGLRFDATHAIVDGSALHILAELTQAARNQARELNPDRELLLYAEDHRNPREFMLPVEKGGLGFDGVWADDIHHHIRRKLAGDHEGYYAHFDGLTENIARTLSRGWFRDGSQKQGPLAEGSNPDELDFSAFVVCIQNHDQIGNRAFGERLHHQISLDLYRAASALILLAPETPLIYMGQEWACTSPFQFFTEHSKELGPLVTAGRRTEFAGFSAFQDPTIRESIPDPQAETTYTNSQLNWLEREQPDHRGTFEFYRALLRLRNEHLALGSSQKTDCKIWPLGKDGVAILRKHETRHLLGVFCLSPQGMTQTLIQPGEPNQAWKTLMTSEDKAFTTLPHPIRLRFLKSNQTIGLTDSNSNLSAASPSPQGNLEFVFARGGAWIGEV